MGDPTKTFCVYNARQIRFVDSNLTAPNTTTNTFTLYNADLTLTNRTASTNLVTLGGLAKPPTNNVLSLFNALVSITDTNELGAGTITLGGTTLTLTQGPVPLSNGLNVVSNSLLSLQSGTNTYSGVLSGKGALTLNLSPTTAFKIRSGLSLFFGSITITNGGLIQFDQGTNSWGDPNGTLFDLGASGAINNHSTNGMIVFLGAVAGGTRIDRAGRRPAVSRAGPVRVPRREHEQHDVCRHHRRRPDAHAGAAEILPHHHHLFRGKHLQRRHDGGRRNVARQQHDRAAAPAPVRLTSQASAPSAERASLRDP